MKIKVDEENFIVHELLSIFIWIDDITKDLLAKQIDMSDQIHQTRFFRKSTRRNKKYLYLKDYLIFYQYVYSIFKMLEKQLRFLFLYLLTANRIAEMEKVIGFQ